MHRSTDQSCLALLLAPLLAAFPRPPEAMRGPLFLMLVLFALLPMAAAQGSSSADEARFHDRWLRAFAEQAIDEIPRFEGPVAEVTRSLWTDGDVTERRVWRFDERGWPTSTELILVAGDREVTFASTWNYGEGGLPSTIEISGSQHIVLFLTWGPSSVEITSETQEARYSYDAGRDEMAFEQSLPQEAKRHFEFRDDGSYAFTFSLLGEDGEWRQGAVGAADPRNLKTMSETAVITTALEITESDDQGNPVEGVRTMSGQRSASNALTWEIVYR